MSKKDQPYTSKLKGVAALLGDIEAPSAAAQWVAISQNGLDGYIVTSMSGYGVVFLGTVPGLDQLLQISAACDCAVEVEALRDLLSRVHPLE